MKVLNKKLFSLEMPATKTAKRSSVLNIRSPVQHWLAHLKLSTLSESHNMLQHSSMMKNRAKYSIVHIARNLLRVLIVGNKNYCKLAGRLKTMLLLNNGSDVYTQLMRMQKIVHESHEYFVEYMRQYIPQHVKSKLEYLIVSVENAVTNVSDSSDYVDTLQNKVFSMDAGVSLKSHYSVIENVKNLFTIMVTETYKVIFAFMESCLSDLLNQTIMREIMKHLSTISHAEFVAQCLRMANAIPLFLKHQEELFFQGLLQLCRVDFQSCVILSTHIEELCRAADETKNEDVRSCALEIMSFIVGRAAKALNTQKSLRKNGTTNGIKHDIEFDKSLYDKLSSVAAMATRQLYRVTSMNSTSVYHSTLRIICGIWRITARRGAAGSDMDKILCRSVESLIGKLDAFEDRDPKSRHLTMMVIAMLARSSAAHGKLEREFVVQRLIEILDETHQRYIKFSDSKDSQVSGSGYIADTETTRSTSCESLIKNGPLSLKSKKQVTFASDCTLASTRSRLYDMASTLRNSKGSLPNLSSPSFSVKPALTNGIRSGGPVKLTTMESQSQFHQQILHNCAIALTRICTNGTSTYFCDYGGPAVVKRILGSEKSNQALVPYLTVLRDIETGNDLTKKKDEPLLNGELTSLEPRTNDLASAS